MIAQLAFVPNGQLESAAWATLAFQTALSPPDPSAPPANVLVFVAPAVALLSWAVKPSLTLSFRPIELATMGAAVAVVGFIVADAKGKRWEGAVMIAVYAVAVILYGFAGDR